MKLGISSKLFLTILSTCILVLIIMHWGGSASVSSGGLSTTFVTVTSSASN